MQTQAFRDLIEQHLRDLDQQDELGRPGQATQMLDQQAIGRLSRMDALQSQAMSQATAARRQSERARLIAALARIDDGDYGYCDSCGEKIAPGRLKLDPAAMLCVACAGGG